MNILLICSGGASTSILVEKIKSNLPEDKKGWYIEALSVTEAKDAIGKFDCVFLAPQIKYQRKVLEEIANPLGVKMFEIEPKDYGNLKPEVIHKLLEKAELA